MKNHTHKFAPKIKFNTTVGHSYASGIPLLDENNNEFLSLNDQKDFMIKFIPTNEQNNQRFFLSLEVDGELAVVGV